MVVSTTLVMNVGPYAESSTIREGRKEMAAVHVDGGHQRNAPKKIKSAILVKKLSDSAD